ncbi:MAG: RdgB/HAM1 family non-canonical purine NTP pyrophosphatase [Bacteroidales bacterium]|jgi:XTP/dITP diphosphohydrolase|nr:RdgB/HAM1 family non-canonical purine NTP pyrophosphatase [Bacteroidales bacterium]
MELIFATHNRHKIEEAAAIAGAGFSILGLTDIGCFEEIPETADSLLGNATQKADFVFQKYHCDCFSDDTGLEIEALQNRPGVYSARYAGEHCSFQDNIDKVMSEMRGQTNRNACFKTVIVLFLCGKKYSFEGEIKGEIIEIEKGTSGFGYDPIFRPHHSPLTFAEMDEVTKNSMSHRAIAMQKMMDFLCKNQI